MTTYKELNDKVQECYGVPVPNYNLKPVFELLTAVNPKEIAGTIGECIIMMADEVLTGNRKPDKNIFQIQVVLKALFRTFSTIEFDDDEFGKRLYEQIKNDKGLFASEDYFKYPVT